MAKKSGAGKSGRHRQNPLNLSLPDYFALERLEVVQMVLQHGIRAARILELGCAAGATAKQFKSALSPERYVGLEMEPEVAEQARAHLSEVHVVDLNATAPEALGLAKESFDLLLALDVLEHLYNPWDVLADYSELLAPGGHAVLSIPNVANVAVIQQLAQGKWQYESAGLLDATHIRFFTRESIGQLVTGAGLNLLHVSSVLNPRPDLTQAREAGNNINLGNIQISNLSKSDVLNLFAFQFLVIAQKPDGIEPRT